MAEPVITQKSSMEQQLPKSNRYTPHEQWCTHFGGKHYSSTFGPRTGYGLWWCSGKKNYNHWCDGWKNRWDKWFLRYKSTNDPNFITSITCYSEKMNNERTLTSKFSSMLNLKFLFSSLRA